MYNSDTKVLTSVIHFVEAVVGLGTNISNFNSGERLMVIQRPERDHKHMSAIVFSINKESGLDNGMCAEGTQTTDPPLGCGEGSAVDLPLVCLFDERGCGLEL